MQASRPLWAPRQKHLLICLDAFGTLFTPREPIPVAYAKAAARCGIDCGDTETGSEVASHFKAAFKDESKRNPNYGKAARLGAEKWWGNVIRNTFTPFLKPQQEVPPRLITELLQQYSTKKAYKIYRDVKPFFFRLRRFEYGKSARKVVVGIITNSDDRVPGILQSFKLKVNSNHLPPAPNQPVDRAKEVAEESGAASPEKVMKLPKHEPGYDDIDFVILSYDVGHEKPDRRIFDAASSALSNLLAEQNSQLKEEEFLKLYVGDDLEKDYKGAVAAGWHAALVDRSNMLGDVPQDVLRKSVWLKNEDGKISRLPRELETKLEMGMPDNSTRGDDERPQRATMAKSLYAILKYLEPGMKLPKPHQNDVDIRTE